jgi:protein-S-isoprenylcysteine O-methyltransferase Ste14
MDDPPEIYQAERKIFLKRLSQVSLYNLGYTAVLFIAAGTLDWVNAWINILLQMAIFFIAGFVVQDADLIEERSQVKDDVKSWDKTIFFINVGLILTILATAGLDYRFGWLPGMPLWINVLGVLMFVLGYAVFVWAMASNTFFSGFVRIQKDRGHAVVSTGPYQYVRHPGYISGTFSILGVPLLLGSF